MTQICVVADPIDPRRRRKRRVHQHHGRADIVQPVGDGLGVEGGDDSLRKEKAQEPGAHRRDLVEMQMAEGALAERAFGHDGQHAGAGAGLQHGVARPDGGGLEGGIGERQRRRELLQADLLLRPLGVGGLQRCNGVQHRQHAARPVRPGAGIAAHGAPIALEEHDGGGFGGLVGVLPDPGALGVGGAEGLRHGAPQRGGVERLAALQDRQQGAGSGEQGIGPRGMRRLRCYGRVDGDGRKGRTRKGIRRRMGVEHGCLRAGMAGNRQPEGARHVRPRRSGGLSTDG